MIFLRDIVLAGELEEGWASDKALVRDKLDVVSAMSQMLSVLVVDRELTIYTIKEDASCSLGNDLFGWYDPESEVVAIACLMDSRFSGFVSESQKARLGAEDQLFVLFRRTDIEDKGAIAYAPATLVIPAGGGAQPISRPVSKDFVEFLLTVPVRPELPSRWTS